MKKNKCERCPFYWTDGMYSENGCYAEEGRCGKFLEKALQIETVESCIVPLWLLKFTSKIIMNIDFIRIFGVHTIFGKTRIYQSKKGGRK